MGNNASDRTWKCPRCRETVDADFDLCWNCGATPDGLETPDFEPVLGEKAPGRAKSLHKDNIQPVVRQAFLLGILVIVVLIFLLLMLPEYANELWAIIISVAFLCLIGLIFGIILPFLSLHKQPAPGRLEKLRRDLFNNWSACPNCLTANLSIAHYCRRCATPLTSHAEIDPLGRIYAMGDTYRKACNYPYKRIILIGMWLIFGPELLFFIIALKKGISKLFEPYPEFYGYGIEFDISVPFQHEDAMYFTLSILIVLSAIVVYSAILYKVTKNYFHRRNEQKGRVGS
ncbi:MAG: hypothetical protein AMJ79_09530 [Phycisphaerae bacterium SM23_30]|nr:MAG: hypothetical protein AMJ79_09530 [Phycisphaerae bacterium SM23_30]